MSVPRWVDTKLAIWLVTMIGAGAMAYQRLETLGHSVADVQATIDEQGAGLAAHAADGDAHATRGFKVAALESDQAKIEGQIERIETRQQKMDRNMVALCTTLGAHCE